MKLDMVRAKERELWDRMMKLQHPKRNQQHDVERRRVEGEIKDLEFEISSYRTRVEQAESLALVKHHV